MLYILTCIISSRSEKPGQVREFIDLLDTLAYVIAGENNLDVDIFVQIIRAKGVYM